jgi:hypothetical protein
MILRHHQGPALTPSTVLSVQYQVPANQSFDVWINDIGLY